MDYPLSVELNGAFSAPVSFVVPDLLIAPGSTPDNQPELFIYLTGFAVLTVRYSAGCFTFDETVRVSEDYSQSVHLLEQLIAAIPDEVLWMAGDGDGQRSVKLPPEWSSLVEAARTHVGAAAAKRAIGRRPPQQGPSRQQGLAIGPLQQQHLLAAVQQQQRGGMGSS